MESRLLTAAENSRTNESSYTASIEAEFKSKSELHENSVKVGLSRTQADSVTKAVSEEQERTIAETNVWQQDVACPETEEGFVRFALTEDHMRLRRHPRSVEVGGKTLYFQERRDYGFVNYSRPYKINSPELKAKWEEYARMIQAGELPGVVLSRVQYNLYVGD